MLHGLLAWNHVTVSPSFLSLMSHRDLFPSVPFTYY